SVACSSLTANSPSDVLKGTMLSCSCKGTCIELNQRIQEGSIVMIKATIRSMEENPSPLPEGFRMFSLAEVKWSKPIEDGNLYNYAIGLRYLPN
ncbi:MAG: hypothetical protein WAU91_14740, partial [Desulfatitalea sp.]